jgi:UDP-N-acetyl-2-amino-2-deoxyglucuronate dehydrogenase
MQETLRLGLVGCGGISRGLYVNMLAGFADRARVVAVCDVVEERARERSAQFQDTYRNKAAEWKAEAETSADPAKRQRLSELAAGCAAAGQSAPRVYSELERFVRDDALQAVIVTTQPVMHPVASIAALEAGRHVFTEGPMAGNLRDADAMIEAAGRTGRKLSVQYGTRFYRHALQAKVAIQSGMLGNIVMGRMDANWYHTAAYYGRHAYQGTYNGEGGGSAFHHGRYGSDLFLHLMAEPMTEVGAFMGTFLHAIETEDASSAALRFKSGALGHVTTTICAHENPAIPYDRVEILGELASLQVFRTPDYSTQPVGQLERLTIGSKDPDYAAGVLAQLDQAVPDLHEDMQVTQMRLFLDCLRNDAPVPVSGESARAHVELARATYKSAFTGQIVTLPLATDDPFYGPKGTMPD